MNRKVLVVLLSVFILVSAIVTSDVVAAWLPPTNTDLCWGGSGHIYRLRFIDVGGGYYQIVGKTTESGGTYGALFGSAITTPTVIQITATNSGSNGGVRLL